MIEREAAGACGDGVRMGFGASGRSAKKAGYFGKKRQKLLSFVLPLPDSIMVVRQILDLYVEVRALVGQQKI